MGTKVKVKQDVVRNLIIERGFTITELTNASGLSRTVIYAMLKGEEVRVSTVGKLANGLSVNFSEITE